MTAPDPHAIARRLTPAQKRALLWLPEDADSWKLRLEWLSPPQDIIHKLHGLALASRFEDTDVWSPTPLGAQVRAIVEQEQGGRDADPS
jgi:hypothetical protein